MEIETLVELNPKISSNKLRFVESLGRGGAVALTTHEAVAVQHVNDPGPPTEVFRAFTWPNLAPGDRILSDQILSGANGEIFVTNGTQIWIVDSGGVTSGASLTHVASQNALLADAEHFRLVGLDDDEWIYVEVANRSATNVVTAFLARIRRDLSSCEVHPHQFPRYRSSFSGDQRIFYAVAEDAGRRPILHELAFPVRARVLALGEDFDVVSPRPGGTDLILSKSALETSATICLLSPSSGAETPLPINGYEAGWIGHHRIAFTRLERASGGQLVAQLCIYHVDTRTWECVLQLAGDWEAGTVPRARVISCDRGAARLAWLWTVESPQAVEDRGIVVVDVDEGMFRTVDYPGWGATWLHGPSSADVVA